MGARSATAPNYAPAAAPVPPANPTTTTIPQGFASTPMTFGASTAPAASQKARNLPPQYAAPVANQLRQAAVPPTAARPMVR